MIAAYALRLGVVRDGNIAIIVLIFRRPQKVLAVLQNVFYRQIQSLSVRRIGRVALVLERLVEVVSGPICPRGKRFGSVIKMTAARIVVVVLLVRRIIHLPNHQCKNGASYDEQQEGAAPSPSQLVFVV